MTIRTIGLDLAKSVFQAHGVDETGATLLTKRLHRKQMLPFFSKLPPCLIGMEAWVMCVKFCKGGHGWLGSCGLAELNFLVLFEIVHIEVAVGFEPVLVGLDG